MIEATVNTLNLLQELGDLGALFGVGVAIFALKRQMSQSQAVAQNSIYQSVIDTFNQFMASIAGSDDLADIYRRGCENPEALEEDERARFKLLCIQYFSFHENLFVQVERGGVAPELYPGWRNDLYAGLEQRGLVWYWNCESVMYAQKFQDLIAARLKEMAGQPAVGSDTPVP